jgi:excisionase family DNA binding protein
MAPRKSRSANPTQAGDESQPISRRRDRSARVRLEVREPAAAYQVTTQSTNAVPRRLLELQEAAEYLGVSPWTVRDLVAAGTIRRVRVPLAGGRELRRLLFDKTELDHLIDIWKAL